MTRLLVGALRLMTIVTVCLIGKSRSLAEPPIVRTTKYGIVALGDASSPAQLLTIRQQLVPYPGQNPIPFFQVGEGYWRLDSGWLHYGHLNGPDPPMIVAQCWQATAGSDGGLNIYIDISPGTEIGWIRASNESPGPTWVSTWTFNSCDFDMDNRINVMDFQAVINCFFDERYELDWNLDGVSDHWDLQDFWTLCVYH